jgi:hypothetical protein
MSAGPAPQEPVAEVLTRILGALALIEDETARLLEEGPQ